MEELKEIQKTELKKDVSLGQKQSQEVLQKESNDLQEHVKELTEENKMLFEQLHIVQEEFEKYYYKLKDAEKKAAVPVVAGSGGIGEVKQISDAYCKHLEKNLEMSNSLRFSEMHNSLQYRIGNAIIKLKDSGVSAPFKLWGILSFFSNTNAPSSLGGNNFTKVIEAYEKGKDKAVKELLNGVKMTSIVKANAYTALAKHYQYRDLSVCVKFASLAYKTDPQAYRLKWWLLRLDDRGDYTTACALVGLLPKDTPMKDVEKAKIDPIRRKAEQFLQQKMHTVKVNSVAPETQKKLDASLKENKKLKDELAAQKKTSEALKQEIHTFKKELSNKIKPDDNLVSPEVQKKIDASLAENKKLRDQLAVQDKNADTMKNELTVRKKNSESLKQEIHTLKEDLSNKIKPGDDFSNENTVLKEHYKVQAILATAHAENLNNIKKSYKKLIKKNVKYKRKIAELQGRLGQTKKTITLVQDEKIKLLQDLFVGKK